MQNNNKKIVKVCGLTWKLTLIDYDYLVEHSKKWHVTDWVWDHGKYSAECLETGEGYFLSHFYKRDIKDILSCSN